MRRHAFKMAAILAMMALATAAVVANDESGSIWINHADPDRASDWQRITGPVGDQEDKERAAVEASDESASIWINYADGASDWQRVGDQEDKERAAVESSDESGSIWINYADGASDWQRVGDKEDKERARRIVGGEIIQPNEFPFLVSIKGRPQNWWETCVGTIVAKNWVLTAAHCFSAESLANYPDRLTVTAGEHDTTRREWTDRKHSVEKVFLHPEFNAFEGYAELAHGLKSNYNHNLALLCIKGSGFDLHRSHIGTVAINTNASLPVEGDSCTILGWGYDNDWEGISPVPQKVQVSVRSADYCKKMHPSESSTYRFCAGDTSKDICYYGDKGAPVICRYNGVQTQVGVADIWSGGCGDPRWRPLYTRVSADAAWLSDCIAGRDCPNNPNIH